MHENNSQFILLKILSHVVGLLAKIRALSIKVLDSFASNFKYILLLKLTCFSQNLACSWWPIRTFALIHCNDFSVWEWIFGDNLYLIWSDAKSFPFDFDTYFISVCAAILEMGYQL